MIGIVYIGFIITQVHLRLNNGMSTSYIADLPQTNTFNTGGMDTILPILPKLQSCCNDQTTVYTDASDDCSTFPEVSDLDLQPESQDQECPHFGQGCCLRGSDCPLMHLSANSHGRMKVLIAEYPELVLCAPRRILSFLP